MINAVKQLYRNVLPLPLRAKVRKIKYAYDLINLRKKIIRYYSKLSIEKITNEEFEVLEYLKENKLCIFPYHYQLNYDAENIEVFLDSTLGLHYVFFEKKRLYFKRSWNANMVKYNYNNLQIEQDKNSPHLYLTDDFFVEKDSVIVDIGVAEGNFSLSVIEKASKIYLFETDYEWIEALDATFAPWKEKIEIVNKFVSNINDDKNITLDSFLKGKENVDFLKIDVDGAEAKVLSGCENILKNKKPLKIALCTYHKQDDGIEFSELLKKNNFEISFSKGYMIFFNDGFDLRPPYFRRGLIRARK